MINPMRSRVQIIIAALSLCLFSVHAYAQQIFNSSVIHQSLESIEFQIFTAGFRGDETVSESIRQVSKHRSNILQCVNDNEEELAATTDTIGQELIEQLGIKQKLSRDEVALADKINQLNSNLTDCKLLLGKSNQVMGRLTALQGDLKKQQLSERTPHLFTNLTQGTKNLPRYINTSILGRITQGFAKILQSNHFLPNIIILIIGTLIGIFIRRKTILNATTEQLSFSGQIISRAFYKSCQWSPLILPLLALLVFTLFVARLNPEDYYLTKLLLTAIYSTFSVVIINALTNSLHQTADPATDLAKVSPQKLRLRLIIITALIAAWNIITHSPAINAANLPTQLLLQSLLTSAVLIALIELLTHLPKIRRFSNLISLIRITAIAFFALCLILDWVGYLSLSRFFWIGILLTTLSIFGFYLIEKLFRDFYDGLDSGQHLWQRKFRAILGVADSEPIPGLIWLRLMSAFILWAILALAFLKSWGISDSSVSTLFSYVGDGFEIGTSRIVPYDVLIGIVAFSCLLMLFKWFKDNLDKKYLSKSRMDTGARDAIVTIAGYVGFVLAAVIGLSIAGFSFANLAIVAGALSLGIGFGLQNIVNNFVSGIILLFERPIRTGDWIVTGSTEGYVKKISVRSTEVQTFDRSDVIVPNSELISTQVTNWTLRDRYGRLTIPVGVAYGSDTALVKKTLEEIPSDIPEIIKNRPQLPIKVYFRNFGDSTLNFELRCFIYDISSIIEVTSKLNFAIDQKFRDNSIEIAFPQLDIHMHQGNKD